MPSEFEQVTFTPRYPAFGHYVTAEAEFKVLEHKDHLEVWRSDSRGRWRRRKTMPRELTKHYRSYRDIDLMKIPHVEDDVPPQVIAGWDVGPARDPVFMEREPNPVTKIGTEDGQVIYRAG